ncbi:peptide chain release factor N(5)-glutamine methyltransferase [Sphingomonas sp. S1-29]|uniref:peptide chain release factor N(5)-glutamine methyltransferase n=1 Tax=Sphingomonas sp. S1-29 TaxID=2991074 RepID=UPI00223FCB04|nr:peptide chain release factor N(5)-glutamine methyltransferase [Sphingomonas sp. S1-29]UZK68932.1 peptide chain release factor N(5)-glutamine methyltransferase [Sphingomonas sp. S1-29]
MTKVSTVRAALADAARGFADFSATPRLDAEQLMAHALGITRERMILAHLDSPAPDAFTALVTRRLAHEPIAYITGTRDFWTITLDVAPGVLVPRADSETLIEAAVEHFGARAPARLLDLGTGSGALLLAALDQWPGATGVGVDSADAALTIASANAARLGMADRATFVRGDWATGIADRFDLIVANPPYIAAEEPLAPEVRDHEPAAALFAAEGGLAAYRAFVPDLPRLLAPGGAAILEIGWKQADAVSALVAAAGLSPTVRADLGGRPRAIIAIGTAMDRS